MVASIIFPALIPVGVSGYTIESALMFDGAADSLTKTFSGSGNRNTYTRSFWIKRTKLGAQMKIFDTGPDGGNNAEYLLFGSDDTLSWVIIDSNAVKYNYQTTQVFRDTTAWYHIVCARDTATVKMYVNGDEITAFAGTPTNTGASNAGRWAHTDQNVIGKYFLSASDFLGGYLAEVIQVDGSILTPTSFGEENDESVWVPIERPESLGTNGFHLDFESADIGNDAAGSNNWTAVSSGPNNVFADSPTDNSIEEVTLYPALDGINTTYQQGTLSNNNKTMTVSSGAWSGYRINMPVTSGGKIYFEFVTASNVGQGAGLTTIVGNIDQPGAGSPYVGKTGNYSMQLQSGFWTPGNAVNVPTGHETGGHASYYKCAYDDSNGKLWFGDADGWYGSSVSDSDVANGDDNTYTVASGDRGGKLYIYCSGYTNGGNTTLRLLSSEWSSSAPSGFSALTQTVTGVGNYATLNPLMTNGNGTISAGNLNFTVGSTSNSVAGSTIGVSSGKFYGEATYNSGSASGFGFGIANSTSSVLRTGSGSYLGEPSDSHGINASNGNLTSGGAVTVSSYAGGALSNGTNYMWCLDMDNGKWWAGNADTNTWFTNSGVGNPATGANAGVTGLTGIIHICASAYNGDGLDMNFGQTAFVNAANIPSGFKALNTADLPALTVTNPSDYFNTVLYEGNGGTLAVPGVGFQPDFVWIKCRDEATNWNVMDVVREDGDGTPSMLRMASSNNGDAANEFDSFDADGFSVTHSAVIEELNRNTKNYVAFCMKAGGSPTTTSPAGTIASSTSVADHGGFSIGTFTVNTSGAFTVGHGLTRDIGMLWIKDRDANSGYWVWSDQLGATTNYLNIYTNLATYTDGATNIWNGVHPGASSPSTAVFSSTGTWLTNTNDHVFYAFARTPGLIAMGSFTGANATDGSYIVLDDDAAGFKPAWFMFKNLGGNGDWYTFNSTRNVSNPVNNLLALNQTKTESTMATDTSNGTIDFTANGVKFRSTNGSDFQGASTFVYLAFAENPFGGSGIAQAKAR